MALPPEGPTRTMLRNMSPPWMLREWGEKFVIGLIGYSGDALLEAATLAVKSPWLVEPTSPDDAVDLQAAETGIRRYPGETVASHRARAVSPWDAYEFAGTEDGYGGEGQGIEGQLILLGYPNAFTLADYEFDFGGDPHWSRFAVFIPPSDHAWTDDGAWDDPGTWDDGGAWDISADPEDIRALRTLIRQWKAGHDRCQYICVIRDGELWDYPEGDWDDPGNWDDGEEPIYLSAR